MERINRYFPLGQLTLLAVNPDIWSDVIANEIARIIVSVSAVASSLVCWSVSIYRVAGLCIS